MSASGREIPPVRFAESKGARIAYQQWGDGPDLVGIPPAAQNIEMAWEWPDLAAMLDRFGSFSRYLHFDKRGTGSSDRMSVVPGYDERVDDLIAVLDDAGIERAHFLGISEGGPMSILFAHAFPERVESLILHGTGPMIFPVDASDDDLAEARAGVMFLCDRWGTPESMTVDIFGPSMAEDREFRRWFEVYERRSSSPQSLRDLLVLWEVDVVGDLLHEITVPVLVQHRVGDRVVSIDNGRALAKGIPGAKIVEYEGQDHFGFFGDVDAWMNDLERWITGTVSERPPRSRADRPEIRTLGGFEVMLGSQVVSPADWGSRIARQIVKRLIAERGRPVTREQLIDQIWPDEVDLPRLSTRLSVHLSSARRILGTALVSDRATVALDLQAVTVDAEELLRATDDDDILACHAGEFLPEDVDEPWAAGLRAETRARFLDAAQRQSARLSALGDHRAARDLAFRLLEADPFDDRGHHVLVAAQRALGRPGEAKRAFDAWCDARAELGLEPPPEDL